MNKSSSSDGRRSFPSLLILLGVLMLSLGILFSGSFVANQVLFSNDGPFGIISSQSARTTPSTFVSSWQDLNWLGNEGITPDASITALLAMVLQPLGYAKFAAGVGLLFLGFCAWVFFRQLRLSPIACVIGAVATALNSDFLSTASWGIAHLPLCIGADFLALAAMVRVTEGSRARSWIRVILAGFAVGMGVVQGADVGALFSMFVAAYVLYQAVFLDNKLTGLGTRFGFGTVRVAVVAAFAAILATHTLLSLVGTQIQGVAGSSMSPAQRWMWLTEWSLPKIEILQLVVPGLFGYRQVWHMYDDQQPKNDQYWGLIGWDGGSFFRLSGTGLYAGVLVLMIALWAIFQALRSRGSPFTNLQRRAIWFWTVILLLTALLSFGRFAPFVQFFYDLPGTSNIRNPTKFMHIFSWALVIVFGYGVHGLVTAYMQNPVARAGAGMAFLKDWWSKAAAFDRKWVVGCGVMLLVSLVAFMAYSSAISRLEDYLVSVGISDSQKHGVAVFSVHAVLWFILFLALSSTLFLLILSGAFSGKRAFLGAGLITLLVAVDLGRADAPWIVYWNLDKKYASDPVTKFLATKPYEHRVSYLPVQADSQQLALMQQAYFSQWKQHIYPLNNIQCAETIQESRVATDKEMFMGALPANTAFNFLRTWELLNVRYILAPGNPDVVTTLNEKWDPGKRRFQTAMFSDGSPVRFNFVPKSPNVAQSLEPVNFNVVPDTNGALQVLEFTGALPRAALFANWQIEPSDSVTLQTLASPNFDPHQIVIVSNAIARPDPANIGQPSGTVEIKDNYQPKRIEMTAEVNVPSVLLYSARYNPKWKVTVDGTPAELLRCNFVEQGVLLPKGKHTVILQFTGTATTFAISLSAVLVALILSGWLAFTEKDIEAASGSPARANDTQRPPAATAITKQPDPQNGADAKKNKPKKA